MFIITDSKEIRNWIITLIILASGVWLLFTIGKTFIAGAAPPQLGVDTSIIASFDSISFLFLLAIGAITILLIPIYFAKRSQEKSNSMKQVNSQT